tara:strand:- start:258 stop:473 length:216 start_codon:yes stop_codon:yes gene_type:complete
MTRVTEPNRPACTRPALLWLAVTLAVTACQPTVRVEAPREPITINLNIQADIRVKIEEQAKQDIRKNDNIF